MEMGGFMFGTRPGQGVATCRIQNGWSAPTFFTLVGGKWGRQFGTENVDLVIAVRNEQGMQNILNNTFDIGAASTAAGQNANAEIMGYAQSRGSLAEISLSGARISQDRGAVLAIYAK
jgi:lipid-binding SYLF domain-containing protein